MTHEEEVLVRLEEFVKNTYVRLQDAVNTIKLDVDENKKHIDRLDDSIHGSCDNMTHLVDRKIDKSKDEVVTSIDDKLKPLYFQMKLMWTAIGSMFFMFIGAVVYFNNQDGFIHNKINEGHTAIYKDIADKHEDVVENGTNIKTILSILREGKE